MINKNFSFNLPLIITKQNKGFVAYTPSLDISTFGKTESEVKSRFIELANLFLEEIVNKQTVDDVLSELGWTKVQKKWTPPIVISSKSIGLSLPTFA